MDKRGYERHATCSRPGDGDWKIVEVRGDRRRVVAADHHAYKDYLAEPHVEPVEVPFVAPVAAAKLDEAQARTQAISEHMGAYLAALAALDCWGATTRDEALAEWRATVQERVDDLMGVTSATEK